MPRSAPGRADPAEPTDVDRDADSHQAEARGNPRRPRALRVLHGEVLPLLRAPPGDTLDARGFRVHPLVPPPRARHRVHRGGMLVRLRPHRLQAPPAGQSLRDLRHPAADLPRVHHQGLRVRGRLGLRPVFRDARAGRRVHGGRARSRRGKGGRRPAARGTRPVDPQPEAGVTADPLNAVGHQRHGSPGPVAGRQRRDDVSRCV